MGTQVIEFMFQYIAQIKDITTVWLMSNLKEDVNDTGQKLVDELCKKFNLEKCIQKKLIKWKLKIYNN
jgi:hypothetical protein